MPFDISEKESRVRSFRVWLGRDLVCLQVGSSLYSFGIWVRPYVFGHGVHHQARVSFVGVADVYLRGGAETHSRPLRGVSPVLPVREGRAQRAEPRGYATCLRQARSPVGLVLIPGALRGGLTPRVYT